jgi:hypothetical protein
LPGAPGSRPGVGAGGVPFRPKYMTLVTEGALPFRGFLRKGGPVEIQSGGSRLNFSRGPLVDSHWAILTRRIPLKPPDGHGASLQPQVAAETVSHRRTLLPGQGKTGGGAWRT